MTMTAEWTPILALPNVSLAAPVGSEIAVLAPADDPRVVDLKFAHPRFREFLSRFSDTFGEKFEPVILLLDAAAPPAFRGITALASFRDIIAFSAITHARTLHLLDLYGPRGLFGEAFALYPWMIDKDDARMICDTPAISGLHEVSQFNGQSSPAVPRTHLGESDIDQPLLEALMVRWRRRYEASDPAWEDEDRALMRSLNMAYHASMLPAWSDTTFYDLGRIVSLWVSAFEILAHPGGSGQANRDKVFDLIERTAWSIDESKQLAHDTGSKKNPVKRTLASWLYQMLYECRNDFLHGNPVKDSCLTLPTSNRNIFVYAAPLYRIALTAFLPLKFETPKPSWPDLEFETPELSSTDLRALRALAVWDWDRCAFYKPQEDTENALLTAVQPPSSRKHRGIT